MQGLVVGDECYNQRNVPRVSKSLFQALYFEPMPLAAITLLNADVDHYSD